MSMPRGIDVVHTLDTTDRHLDEPTRRAYLKWDDHAAFQRNRIIRRRDLAIWVVELRVPFQRFHTRNMQIWDAEKLLDSGIKRSNRIGVPRVQKTLLAIDFNDRDFFDKFKSYLICSVTHNCRTLLPMFLCRQISLPWMRRHFRNGIYQKIAFYHGCKDSAKILFFSLQYHHKFLFTEWPHSTYPHQ